MVFLPARVRAEPARNVCGVQHVVDTSPRVSEEPVDVVDTLPTKQARVRGVEALLRSFVHFRRNIASYVLPENPLSVAGFELIPMPLARLVCVYSYRCLDQPTQLVAGREAQSEVDQVVVEKRRPRLQGVSHAHLVLDEKDAGQKGLELEVQRGVDE